MLIDLDPDDRTIGFGWRRLPALTGIEAEHNGCQHQVSSKLLWHWRLLLRRAQLYRKKNAFSKPEGVRCQSPEGLQATASFVA
jgi:hypothetical protein